MKAIYRFNTKYGAGEIYFDEEKIIKFKFYFDTQLRIKKKNMVSALVKQLRDDIVKYLSGEKVNFNKYNVDLSCFTKFERDIVNNLRRVEYGKVISYKKLGEVSGYKDAARAVGNVMKKNPFPIIIPCHRVVKSNGNIGGYSLGEQYKKFLLDMEHSRKDN